jgi:hypothetical protein
MLIALPRISEIEGRRFNDGVASRYDVGTAVDTCGAGSPVKTILG